MRKIKSLFVLLLTSVSSIVLGQQNQEVTLQSFNKIDVQGIMKVELVKGKTNKITTEALNGANLEDLTVAVSGGELGVKTKIFKQLTDRDNNKRKADSQKLFKVRIEYTNELASLQIGRGAELVSAETLTGNRLLVDASSGAIVTLKISVNNLELSSVQGAIVNLEGKATFQQTKVNTGGELFAYNLISDEVEIRAHTGGVAQVSANKMLDASAGTGGMINYKGNPSERNVKSNLGGEVRSN
ncbi:head GIN domain-containing protein [Arcicella aquatica]|uniref:Head GIN domain-containing protein n=1 Tax=Arcicella aquatica TaxID=217141 RepID=A0ABU5QRQ3_9BACT|nr:head GIN domain-containing protein [Arcicella aquatica]MEA5259748.1 head GIN domain-containing protein [Arcicella aquatica]